MIARDDPPLCRFCAQPVHDPARVQDAIRVAAQVNADRQAQGRPPYEGPTPHTFCSDECIRAKYIG